MAGCCYNAYLSFYYCMLVRKSWQERDFKIWMEVLGNCIAVFLPLVLVTGGAMTQSINPQSLINNLCLYSPWPWECVGGEVECTRSSLELVRTVSGPAILFIGAFSSLGFLCTGLVWFKVKNTIRRSINHNFDGDMDESQRNRLQQVRKQATLYSLVYLNAVIWPSVLFALSEMHLEKAETVKLQPAYYAFQLVFWALQPLQGFLNFFVFTRMKRKLLRKHNPERSIFWIYKQILQNNSLPRRGARTGSSQRSRSRSRMFSSFNLKKASSQSGSTRSFTNHSSSRMGRALHTADVAPPSAQRETNQRQTKIQPLSLVQEVSSAAEASAYTSNPIVSNTFPSDPTFFDGDDSAEQQVPAIEPKDERDQEKPMEETKTGWGEESTIDHRRNDSTKYQLYPACYDTIDVVEEEPVTEVDDSSVVDQPAEEQALG